MWAGGRQQQEALLSKLTTFLEGRAPLASLSGDPAAGIASWMQRAAVLLWVWLEACHCPMMAEEAHSPLLSYAMLHQAAAATI